MLSICAVWNKATFFRKAVDCSSTDSFFINLGERAVDGSMTLVAVCSQFKHMVVVSLSELTRRARCRRHVIRRLCWSVTSFSNRLSPLGKSNQRRGGKKNKCLLAAFSHFWPHTPEVSEQFNHTTNYFLLIQAFREMRGRNVTWNNDKLSLWTITWTVMYMLSWDRWLEDE